MARNSRGMAGRTVPAALPFHRKFQISRAGKFGRVGGGEVYLEGAGEVVAGEVLEFPVHAHAEGGRGPIIFGDEFPMGFVLDSVLILAAVYSSARCLY